EQGLAAVGAVTRATTRELQMLRQAAIEAGIRTQFSPSEAVAGLQSLATAGQTAEQATRTLIPVLDLAAGSLGQLGVAQAAEAVVGTLNAYGLAADRAAGVTDKLLGCRSRSDALNLGYRCVETVWADTLFVKCSSLHRGILPEYRK
uniref:phage tail tape measure protein n=1 Tax=Oceanithermus sp. TaxID=2268145 RepID=UPI0025FE5EE5